MSEEHQFILAPESTLVDRINTAKAYLVKNAMVMVAGVYKSRTTGFIYIMAKDGPTKPPGTWTLLSTIPRGTGKEINTLKRRPHGREKGDR